MYILYIFRIHALSIADTVSFGKTTPALMATDAVKNIKYFVVTLAPALFFKSL